MTAARDTAVSYRASANPRARIAEVPVSSAQNTPNAGSSGRTRPAADASGASSGPTAGSQRARDLLHETASRRSRGWRRLAEAFYDPDEAWLAALLAGDVDRDLRRAVDWLDSDRKLFDEALDALARFVADHGGDDRTELMQELAVGYAGLFIGPSRELPAQPYESVWIDRDPDSGKPIFGGPSTTAVEATYARHGLVRTDDHHDLPDHVATEAEFLCYLCDLEAAAWAAGDVEAARELRSSEQRFLTDHLGRFAPKFSAAVQATAPDSVYSALAGFLVAYLTVESGTPYVDVVTSIWNSPEPPPGAHRLA